MTLRMLFLSLFIFMWQLAIGVNAELDSLKQQVLNMTEDSLKCEAYLRIAYLLYSGEESEKYAQKAMILAKTLHDPYLEGKSYHRLAWCHGYDEMDKKTSCLDSAAIKFESIHDLNGLGKVFDTKGAILMEYGSLADAQAAFQQSFDYYKESGNEERQAGVLSNWAISEYMRGNLEEALAKYNIALNFRLRENPKSPLDLARIYQGMGESSRLQGNQNLAATYFLEGYAYRASVDDLAVSESLLSLASLIYDAAEAGRDTTKIVASLSQYGFPDSESLLERVEEIGQHDDIAGFRSSILDVKRKRNLIQGNYQMAYQLLWELKELEESNKLSKSSLEAFADMKIKYEKDRLTIRLLEEEITNRKSANQVNVLLLSLGILFLVLLIGLLYYQNRMKASLVELTEARREQQIVALRSMMEGQEKERSRIARDLHDGLGNLLSTLKVNMNSLQINFEGEHAQRIYGTASNMIDEACTEVRKIAHEMMPQALKRLGLLKAVEDLVQKTDASHDFDAQFLVYGKEQLLDDNTNVMLYRITQELLNNIVKYADADEVMVQLTFSDDGMNLTVEDDGKGFDPTEVDPDQGMGLKSIEFRAEYIGGELEIESRPGAGTLVSIHLPTTHPGSIPI